MNDKNKYAEVILDIKTYEIDHAFDYIIPTDLCSQAGIGCAVLVPFRSRLEIGYIVGLKGKTSLPEKKLKPIKKILSGKPLFDSNKLKLINWLSSYYIHPIGSAFKLFMPPGRKVKSIKVWRIRDREAVEAELKKAGARQLICGHLIYPKGVKTPQAEKALRRLAQKEAITSDYILEEPKAKLKYKNFISLNEQEYLSKKESINWKKSYRQKKMIDYLLKEGKTLQEKLIRETGASYASLNSLVDKKILSKSTERVSRNFKYDLDIEPKPQIVLNQYQKKCVEKIGMAMGKSSNFLIQGVTGSGKTEVYAEICKKALKKENTCLVLAPEISLIPQLYGRFKNIFGDAVAVFHSNMNSSERYERWLEIQENRYGIIIGTRSALFTPLRKLGLIVIDEEHDPSYKENSAVRYNAQDVALEIGEIFSIPVVMGSATPSVKTRYRAEKANNFQILRIPVKAQTKQKVGKEVVDLKEIDRFKNNPIISNKLHSQIRKETDKNNKIIIFLNRRGYSNFIVCNNCGNVPKCPSCNLALKYHFAGKKLVCHHCGLEIKFLGKCQKCGGENIFLKGFGIQRVEQELKLRFKPVPVLRMDSDATTKRKSHERILKSFSSPGSAILIGTQMVAKGLDIEDITLVGIINCDHMLELPDFHMYERVYQLIHQVAGRTGRKHKQGKVIIQTYNPRHGVIRNFLEGDYDSFYREELQNREELGYPPFSNIINVIISGKDEDLVRKDINNLFAEINKIIKMGDRILGPAPAPFSRINKYYRWHLMIKAKKINQINKKLANALKSFGKARDNRLIVDVDPIWIL
ncbi:MAG: replication restart helicase PriA [Actinomycetota bacterium]